MRTTTSFILTFAVLPLTAFALTIEPANTYSDVRASSPAAAGINLLSREGIIRGYGNGQFGFSRLINRAEFLKIAMKSSAQEDAGFSPADCFADVRSNDWFSPFICAAKQKGIVSGKENAGMTSDQSIFDPAATVTYGEALKMLTVAFGYEIYSVGASHWAEAYYRAAAARQVDLPVTINLDSSLTRSLAARLTAAFFAESKGQLSALRLAEAGQYSPASSSSSSISISSSSSSSSSSVSSSAATKAALFTLPSVSHFLITGEPSDAIADLIVRKNGDTARIVSAQMKLFNEVTSLESIDLVNALDGTVIMTLKRRTTTDLPDYKMIYEAALDLTQQVKIPADSDVRLVFRANIRALNNNGVSDQFLQPRSASVTLHGETTNETINIPGQAPFAAHQIAFGRITAVTRVSPAAAPLVSQTGALISAFSFSGSVLASKSLSVEQLTFSVTKIGSLTVKNWRIGTPNAATLLACSIGQDLLTVTCPNLGVTGALPTSTPLVFELRADTWVPSGAKNVSLQTDLLTRGTPNNLGSVQWTDQSGHFRWIEGAGPVARGTLLQ